MSKYVPPHDLPWWTIGSNGTLHCKQCGAPCFLDGQRIFDYDPIAGEEERLTAKHAPNCPLKDEQGFLERVDDALRIAYEIRGSAHSFTNRAALLVVEQCLKPYVTGYTRREVLEDPEE